MLEANPVLEAFGNAKTLRNNNSSRFGKWVEIHFDNRGQIASSKMDNYLLEKSRLVRQQKNERNFHIFYQLFSDPAMKTKYKLRNPSDFFYMAQSGCVQVPGIDDAKEFDAALRALRSLNFSDEQIDFVTRTVAGILFLGNLKFKAKKLQGTSDKGSQVTLGHDLDQAAGLLGVETADLAKAITNRTIVVGIKRTVIPLSKSAAADAKDAIAKAIYGRLFDWLVKRINKATEGPHGKFVGVLDIFGFEIFETNSFEQLCINYANEKLQQHFNKHTFKEEEAVYISEEIEYTKIPFIDNQPVLNLIEKKPAGLLVALDDEIRVGGGTDKSWMQKMDSTHHKRKCFPIDPRLRRKEPLKFMVEHYAGKVVYDAHGFIEKNKDTLFLDGKEVMANSKSKFMRSLFPTRKRGPTKTDSAGGKFRRQLNSLMKLLNSSQPGYIRCIKPNETKSKNKFDTPMCIAQLRYSGVFEAVKIRKTGYPFRLTHKQFVARYRCILSRADGSVLPLGGGKDFIKNIQSLVKQAIADISKIVIGRTLVLYKAREHRLLQLMRHLALERIVPECLRVVRGFLARAMAKKLRKSSGVLQKALDVGNDIELLDKAIDKVTEIIGSMARLFPGFMPKNLAVAKELRRKLHQWVKATNKFIELETIDPNDCFAELSAAVAVADSIQDIPHTEYQQILYKSAKRRLNSCAAIKIDPEAREALDLLDRDRMEAVLEEAKGFSYMNDTLREIEELLKKPESVFVRLQLKRAVERKDPAMRINREIRLTEIYLEEHKHEFDFADYTKLKHPREFANASWLPWGRDKLASEMMKHTSKPVHTSMTELGKHTSKAKNIHKCILGYMGDRPYTNPKSLVVEMLQKGMVSSDVATEVFCLIIKQMTENPAPSSCRKGVELMAIAVSVLPIAADFEYYLMTYLNENFDNAQAFISVIHERKYGGDKYTAPPGIEEIDKICTGIMRRESRSRYSFASGSRRSEDMERSVARAVASVKKIKAEASTKAAPPPLPSSSSSKPDAPVAIAWWDFTAQDDTMMSFKEGDKLLILEQSDNGWWKASSIDGKTEGYVPANYIKMEGVEE